MRLPARLSLLSLVVSICSVLTGCAMAVHSLVSPMLDSGIKEGSLMLATPESVGISTAQHRGKNCATLNAEADTWNIERAKPQNDALVAKIMGWQVDAINQVRAEQGCNNPLPARSSVATQAPAATARRPVVAAASSPVQGDFRAQFDAVTPSFAQSLGLGSTAGALVIDTDKGGNAERAGLRPLDVVLEVGGQVVNAPSDLQAIVGRMRPGYKAAVRVWRQKAMRDMVIEVAAPAR